MTEHAVPFETTPLTERPGASRHTVPAAGLYAVGKPLPFTAAPASLVEVQLTQTAPRLLFDPEQLRAQVGQCIAINGPQPTTGVLRSVDASEDGLAVTLRIEVDRD